MLRDKLHQFAITALCLCGIAITSSARGDEEEYLFTAPGFDKPGMPITLDDDDAAHLKITVIDRKTGKPTPCRINVVGPDGNYYQPAHNYLTPFGLTGIWPKTGKGNRPGKAPYRYFGRFFYSWGEADVAVPPGDVRIEVWKGFEYRPVTLSTTIAAGKTEAVNLKLDRTLKMPEAGYYAGDPHIHITRSDARDEDLILDLMEAEGIRYGTILAYNEPAGPYTGVMKTLDMPQYRGLGRKSFRARGNFQIISGQEYRSRTFGHLNLFQRDSLTLGGQALDLDDGPPYGMIARETKEQGGFAFYAHGGYAQAIYADLLQGDVDGVELLQFGVYRGIGLEDWYRVLNIGYRFPAIGACDFPACRKLGDCKTYIEHDSKPTFDQWLQAAREGRSFVTTGPMLQFEIDGHKPGDVIHITGNSEKTFTATVNLNSEVAPVTHLQLIVNGEVIHEDQISPPVFQRSYLWAPKFNLDGPAWVAVRAYSKSPQGNPDAEAHTNPIYIDLDGKRPYDRASLDGILAKLDEQIAVQKKRDFKNKAEILAYYERSRDILIKIRETNGIPAGKSPDDIARDDLPNLTAPGARAHTETQLREFLKPVPPKSPAESLKTLEAIDGFEMQLVAHEPLVYDPIAAAFDENGNLYVCEMRDYPYFPQPGEKPIGTVRLLRDTDGDGTFDDSHVFAEELLWAGGVSPWKGGVFVAAPPDIWYMKDTDGDHRADVRRKVFTGFGTKNQQAMLNNLIFGLDHKIYGATAGNGGQIRPADHPDAEPISVDGRDFRFDPVTETFESITGTIQFGNTFDDWGNRFVCSESQPLRHPVLPQRYLARNPYLPVPGAIDNIAGGAVPIFRISPIERWRHIRSSRRIEHGERDASSAGASHHVVDAAAGITIYRGGAYPAEFYGDVFVGDAQNNLVHRRRLTPSGATFTSKRIDEQTEFVRSSDNWFRPVNFINAPDGTLYMLDMSREILESIHIPSDVVKFLDLKSGRQHGRIYRIAPTGFQSPPPPKLSQATGEELVAALQSPHGWWRDTAHRLIFERQDKSLVEPLRDLLRNGKQPNARLHALWSLEGLGALSDADLLTSLDDSDSHLGEHAIRLAETRLDDSPELLQRVINLAGSQEKRLRFQAAFSLGESKDPRAVDALLQIAKQDADDVWLRTAVLSSIAPSADTMLVKLLDDGSFLKSSPGTLMSAQLALVVGVKKNSAALNRVLHAVATHPQTAGSAAAQRRLLIGLGDGLTRGGTHFDIDAKRSPEANRMLKSHLRQAIATALDEQATLPLRADAIRYLGCNELLLVVDTLDQLLDIREPLEVQTASLKALAEYHDARVAELLLEKYRQLPPELRVAAARMLLSRSVWTLAFLQAASQGDVSAAQVDAVQRDLLLRHRDNEIRDLAALLFGQQGGSARGAVVASYVPALKLTGRADEGARIFKEQCTVCHRIGNEGFAIGPDLTSTAARDPQALLTHIFDPNRYVLPNYEQYTIIDTAGRIHTGMIAAQTATSITLKREKNETETILRGNIDEMASTGKSLMPEGLEKNLTHQHLADLLAFLQSVQGITAVDPNRRLDIGTEPGLVEPKK